MKLCLLFLGIDVSFYMHNSGCQHFVALLYFLISSVKFIQMIMVKQGIPWRWLLSFHSIYWLLIRYFLQLLIQIHVLLKSSLFHYYVSMLMYSCCCNSSNYSMLSFTYMIKFLVARNVEEIIWLETQLITVFIYYFLQVLIMARSHCFHFYYLTGVKAIYH